MGAGSYAKVKSAYDIHRKHKIAIKIINKKKAYDEYLTKFLPREIDAMKTLSNHYSLIKFYQIIETTSRYFFIMELAENGDLLTSIKAKTTIAEDLAGKYFMHLHDGIKYMHGKGLVHRDIKCENLVLDKKDILKITDFGFAKRIGRSKTGSPVLSETYCGSYAYAPPEILKGIPYDPEVADVWSMGVVLFTMVYGRLPYDDADHKRLLKQVTSRVIFPSKPDISDRCRILIIKILSKAQDRVPLKNIKADPWFKEQVLNHTHVMSEKDVNDASDRKVNDNHDNNEVTNKKDQAVEDDKGPITNKFEVDDVEDDETAPDAASQGVPDTAMVDKSLVIESAAASGAT